ncbi:MAG: hypothetical protein HY917_05690, partial [Candidatus Diapherotrites archaeon]|nr:hypothetical protein [Candidatus Diapherotrites archaeon]
QAYFLTEGNPRLTHPEYGLSRKLATYYAGWRKKALSMGIRAVHASGRTAIIDEAHLARNMENTLPLLKEINETCTELKLVRKESPEKTVYTDRKNNVWLEVLHAP